MIAASPLPGAERRAAGSVPTQRRREIRCRDCSYGAVVAHSLSSCPMCGCSDWRAVRDDLAADVGEVMR